MATSLRVLVVCTANICRSPLVEGVLRMQVARAGLERQVEVASAATWDGYLGEPADRRAVAAALRRGIDLRAHRARKIEPADGPRFDLLLGMAREHVAALHEVCGLAVATKVRLFLDLVPGHEGLDVPDPFGGGPPGFELVLDLAEAGCLRLLAELRQRLGR